MAITVIDKFVRKDDIPGQPRKPIAGYDQIEGLLKFIQEQAPQGSSEEEKQAIADLTNTVNALVADSKPYLEFIFKPEYDTVYLATIGNAQAGTYGGDSKSGVGSVAYRVNGNAVGFPFIVKVGDELQVSMTHNTQNTTAIIGLFSI